jgi:hypothetical protein
VPAQISGSPVALEGALAQFDLALYFLDLLGKGDRFCRFNCAGGSTLRRNIQHINAKLGITADQNSFLRELDGPVPKRP